MKANTVKDAGKGCLIWKSHLRNLFDEILQNNTHMQTLHKPLQISLNIIAAAATYAVETGDEKMIGYFARLAIYNFSDPTNKDEYDSEKANYYINKTKKQ